MMFCIEEGLYVIVVEAPLVGLVLIRPRIMGLLLIKILCLKLTECYRFFWDQCLYKAFGVILIEILASKLAMELVSLD